MSPQIPLHPVIVHTPIALIIFSAFFALAGLLFDRDWVRRASVLMLVFGFFGAIAANLSGNAAEEIADDKQGVPEGPIEEHEAAGRWAMFMSGGAVLLYLVSARMGGGAKQAVRGAAIVAQLCAAGAVGVAGFRGGGLVYEHAAGVKVGGQYVQHPAGSGIAGSREAGATGVTATSGEAGEKGESEEHEKSEHR